MDGNAKTILTENLANMGMQEFSKWLIEFCNGTKSMSEWTKIIFCLH